MSEPTWKRTLHLIIKGGSGSQRMCFHSLSGFPLESQGPSRIEEALRPISVSVERR